MEIFERLEDRSAVVCVVVVGFSVGLGSFGASSGLPVASHSIIVNSDPVANAGPLILFPYPS